MPFSMRARLRVRVSRSLVCHPLTAFTCGHAAKLRRVFLWVEASAGLLQFTLISPPPFTVLRFGRWDQGSSLVQSSCFRSEQNRCRHERRRGVPLCAVSVPGARTRCGSASPHCTLGAGGSTSKARAPPGPRFGGHLKGGVASMEHLQGKFCPVVAYRCSRDLGRRPFPAQAPLPLSRGLCYIRELKEHRNSEVIPCRGQKRRGTGVIQVVRAEPELEGVQAAARGESALGCFN